MPWQNRVRKFFQLARPERVRLLLFVLAFPAVSVALRLSRYRSVVKILEKTSQPGRRRPRTPLAAERVADLVDMASRATVLTPNCLQRSVVLWWALGREGWDSEIRFGVRKRAGDAGFDFHAWVVRNGRVINDHPFIEGTFIPLTTPTELPPEARFV